MSLILIYLGFGSNAECERHLHAGPDVLAGFLHNLRYPPVPESEPADIKSGSLLNLVVSARIGLSLAESSLRLKYIEADNGRYASECKGLLLDTDVLLHGDLAGDFDGLVLSHVEVLENVFVLWPLPELALNLEYPVARQSLGDLWREVRIQQKLRLVSFGWRGQVLTPEALLQVFLCLFLQALSATRRVCFNASLGPAPFRPFSTNGFTLTTRATCVMSSRQAARE